MKTHLRIVATAAALVSTALAEAPTPRWEIPLAGNAYLTGRSEATRDGLDRRRGLVWQDPASVFSIYLHIDRPATLDLAFSFPSSNDQSTIKTTAAGTSFETRIAPGEARDVAIGRVEAKQAGYLRVDLQGLKKSADSFGNPSHLVITSATAGLTPAFVKSNDGNMFYWGRRGPSVHLGYQMPPGKTIEYAYSELTVPVGQDPAGSYFMANGFGEGYFGIPVKGPTERWILFSVWSPFQTDNPRDIPEDQRVELLAKGPDVRVGEFGNEGSGGQSYRIFPWKAGTTYRFLNSVKPDGSGNSIYSAWFSEADAREWQLIARFKRPKTDKHLTGFHSFLENFYDNAGHLERRGLHGNQWVRDTDGNWHEIVETRFTGDATASGRHRLDFAGGNEGSGFFLRNGGFFSDNVALNQRFRRPSTPDARPDIDFGKLP